jgi:uncharacterized membrane protein
MLISVLRFLNIFSMTLLAGGTVMALMAIVPAKRDFPAAISIQVHNAMLHKRPDQIQKPLGTVAGLSALGILGVHFFWGHNLRKASLLFTVIGLAALLGVIIASECFNIPINLMMQDWGPDSVPENYPEIRDQWDRVHFIRTTCALLGSGCFLIAGLVPVRQGALDGSTAGQGVS